MREAVKHTRAGGQAHRQFDQEHTWKKAWVTRGATRDVGLRLRQDHLVLDNPPGQKDKRNTRAMQRERCGARVAWGADVHMLEGVSPPTM